MPTSRILARTTAAAVAMALVPSVAASAEPAEDHQEPRLVGRAVLPVATYADGPESGSFFTGVQQPPHVINSGIQFPLPSQPVQGFSAIIDGRSHGEFLAMPDNGFGAKANSFDFLIRAYYIRPDFKTRHGGSGTVDVDAAEGEFIEFRDPKGLIGFPIVNGSTPERLLTGADIDPESLQRGHNGDLWVGDEFGPWILHFDADGVLLDAPFDVPGLRSPNNPFLDGQPATQPNSRGFEGMAISPNGNLLYAALEGPTVAEIDKARRYIFEFDVRSETFTGNRWQYRAENADQTLISDMDMLDPDTLVLIERDAGRGLTALFRTVYAVELDDTDSAGFVVKTPLTDLAAIPDPDLLSLPPIHTGDVGLGDPFRVTCESVEAVRVLNPHQLLVGCDNNFPNSGRNPNLADDNEFIIVSV